MSADPHAGDQVRRLAFYATPPHECSYLPGREAVTLFADPYARMTNDAYSRLTLHGFRRSGGYVYRPACPGCSACVPVRIPVSEFRPSRSQRRAWARNQDLEVRERPSEFRDEHFHLYCRYMHTRHPGGGMDQADAEKYMDFLTSDWSETGFVEFRAQGHLVSVAVIDYLQHGLSAVYTFFDPDEAARSLGTHAILWEVHRARGLGLAWLFLGYWIRECPQMAYKAQFRPLERFHNGHWEVLPPPGS